MKYGRKKPGFIQNADVIDVCEQHATSPEERLWVAVIHRAVLDWHAIFHAVKRQIARSGTYSAAHLYNYQALKHELSSEWFENVCFMANFPQSKVLKYFYRDAKACGLFEVKPRPSFFVSHAQKHKRGFH